jgi:hypothetical protein
MRVVGAILAVLVLGGALGSAASAEREAASFPVRFDGSVGPLRLGMRAAAAQRFLHTPRYPASRNGVKCAQYVMADGLRRGLVGVCFNHFRVTGFSVSGPVFCFAPGACVNGRDPVPKRIRKGFSRELDRRNAVYYSYKPVRLLNRRYQVVMEAPAGDPTWSVRAIGFGPCGTSAMVRYYVPIKC